MKNSEIHSNFIRFFPKSKKIIPKSSNCCNLMRNKAFSVRIASFESHLNRVFFKVLLNGGQSILMVKLELWNFPKKHDILMSTLKQKFLNLKFEYQNVLHGGKPLYSYFHRKFFICSIRIVFSKNLSCKLQQERMEKITFLFVKIG